MLGGSDDDIEDLLEECNNIGDGNQLLPRMDTRVRSSSIDDINTNNDVGAREQGSGNNNDASGNFAVAIQALTQLSKDMVEVVREGRRVDGEGQGGKRKIKDNISYHPQEPVLFLERNYHIEDDAHDRLDLKAEAQAYQRLPLHLLQEGSLQ